MIIDKITIEKYNDPLVKEHQRQFRFISEGLNDAEGIIKKLIDFQVAIPNSVVLVGYGNALK